MKENLSRRNFLKLAGLSGIAVADAALFGGELILPQLNYLNLDTSFIENRARPIHVSPPQLIGNGLNIPDLFSFSNENVEIAFKTLRDAACNYVIVFPSNFEAEFGKYEMKGFEGMDNALNLLQEFNEKNGLAIKMVVPIIDFYGALYSPVLYSPYYKEAVGNSIKEKQQAIFVSKKIKDGYQNRAEVMIARYQNYPEIIWEVGNEPSVSGINIQLAQEILTDWYEEMIDFIQSGYNGPLLLGLQSPWKIDESRIADRKNIINTLHAYQDLLFANRNLQRIRDYCLTSKLPLILSEIGLTDSQGGANLLPYYILAVLKAGNVISGVAPWKAYGHHDGYDVGPQYRNFIPFMQEINGRFAKLYAMI